MSTSGERAIAGKKQVHRVRQQAIATAKRAAAEGGDKRKVGDHIFEELSVFNVNAAGIDIGSELHYVSVPEDRDVKPVRTFGCYTPDLEAMAAWLLECAISTVVMESTGVYWVPAYQVLTAAGLDVQLVDAHHAKGVPGRKTDVWDCRWLRKLHTFGLLKGCFIPCAKALELRNYWRQRASLVEGATQQVLRIQKALEQMNIQLHKAISDITGMTGMAILRAIDSGERDPHVLAAMRHKQIKASEETIVKAMTGTYREDHLFTFSQALAAYDFAQAQIGECDVRIKLALAKFEDTESKDSVDEVNRSSSPASSPAPSDAPAKPVVKRPRKTESRCDMRSEFKRILGVDLSRIEGVSTSTIMTLLAECGPDLSSFPTSGHFASWLAICPNNQITGGKVRNRRTRPGKNRLATALCLAAQSLHRSQSAMGAFYRRIRGKLGAPKAITATAHRIARVIYMMLTRGQEYVEQGEEAYQAQCEKRQLDSLTRQAQRLGFVLKPLAAKVVS